MTRCTRVDGKLRVFEAFKWPGACGEQYRCVWSGVLNDALFAKEGQWRLKELKECSLVLLTVSGNFVFANHGGTRFG